MPLWLLCSSAFECIILNGHVGVSCCLATSAVCESNESTEKREHVGTEKWLSQSIGIFCILQVWFCLNPPVWQLKIPLWITQSCVREVADRGPASPVCLLCCRSHFFYLQTKSDCPSLFNEWVKEFQIVVKWRCSDHTPERSFILKIN